MPKTTADERKEQTGQGRREKENKPGAKTGSSGSNKKGYSKTISSFEPSKDKKTKGRHPSPV